MTSLSPTENISDSQRNLVGGLGFILIWSTGYIAAAFALEGSGGFTLASMRFVGTALLVGLWLMIRAPARPARSELAHACIAGLLLHAGFFGFIYAGMRAGVPPSAAGLIAGLMPLTTSLFAVLLLGERMRLAGVMGLGLGVIGVLIVVVPDLQTFGSGVAYVLALCALLSLSIGTVYQKRHGGQLDARLGLVVQVGVSSLVVLPFAAFLEGFELHLSAKAIGGVVWVTLVNSCLGLLLYLWLIRRGAAGKVASLFFLVPPVTALMCALVLGTRFTAMDTVGFGLAAAGVWLGQRGN
tara:strand:- start:43374 stop:44264 length:891 start_codon:yes stop_codon:yes gene_type:complete